MCQPLCLSMCNHLTTKTVELIIYFILTDLRFHFCSIPKSANFKSHFYFFIGFHAGRHFHSHFPSVLFFFLYCISPVSNAAQSSPYRVIPFLFDTANQRLTPWYLSPRKSSDGEMPPCGLLPLLQESDRGSSVHSLQTARPSLPPLISMQ